MSLWNSKKPIPNDDSRFFSLTSPSLEANYEELERLRQEQKEALRSFSDQQDEFVQVDELRQRIAWITRRNKERSILVIPFVKEDNPLVQILLQSNSNATASFVRNITEGISRLRHERFDMIYLVIDFAKEGHGPCFLSASTSEDYELRQENQELMKYAEEIRDFAGDAEIVLVCGTAQKFCPIAQKLFEVEFLESSDS